MPRVLASKVAIVDDENQDLPDIAKAPSTFLTNGIQVLQDVAIAIFKSPINERTSPDLPTHKHNDDRTRSATDSVSESLLSKITHAVRTRSRDEVLFNDVMTERQMIDNVLKLNRWDIGELHSDVHNPFSSTVNKKDDNAMQLFLREFKLKIQDPSYSVQRNLEINPFSSFHNLQRRFSPQSSVPSEKRTPSLSESFNQHILQDDNSNNFVKFQETAVDQNVKNDIDVLPSRHQSEPSNQLFVNAINTRNANEKGAKMTSFEDQNNDDSKLHEPKLVRRRRLAPPPPKKALGVADYLKATTTPSTKLLSKMTTRPSRTTVNLKTNIKNIKNMLKKNEFPVKAAFSTRESSTADVETTSITGSEVEIVEDREADRKCSQANGCLTRTQPITSDAYWAAGSLMTVLLVLTIGVLYTGLLKKRNDFDRVFVAGEQNGDIEMETMNSSQTIQSKLSDNLNLLLYQTHFRTVKLHIFDIVQPKHPDSTIGVCNSAGVWLQHP